MQWKPVFVSHFSFLVESGPGCSFEDSTLFSMSCFKPKLQRESKAMHNQRNKPGNRACRQGIIGGQILINSHVCLLRCCRCVWVQVPPCLCSGHVLPRCSAMLGATGLSLQVLIVFWSAGLGDNLHPIATECDSAEASESWEVDL